MIRTPRQLDLRYARGLSLVLAVVAFGLAAAPAVAALTADQQRAILAEAQEAYARGVSVRRNDPDAAREAFVAAAERFQQLVDDGVENGLLRYNLGNAWLQSGDVGRAILNYRWAERLIPGDPRLEHNLEYARSLRRNRIAPSGERELTRAVLGWHTGTPLAARLLVFQIAFVSFWLVLIVHRFRPGPVWRWSAGALAVVWIATGASVAVHWTGAAPRHGVVLRDDVAVRKGNGEGFELQFAEPLHQGVEFEVSDRRPGWLRIELPDGKTGWIRAEHAALVGVSGADPAPGQTQPDAS